MIKSYLTVAVAIFGIVGAAVAEEATVITKDGVAVADSDGNVTAVGNDGSVLVRDADGNEVAVAADGAVSIKDEDGNEVHEDADGNVTIIEAE